MFGPDAGAELTHLHVSSHILLIVAAQTSASEVDARRSAWKSVLSAAIKADASGSPTTILPRLAVRARLRPMVTLTACAGRTQHKGSAGTGLWDQGPRSTALTVPLPALKGARSYLRHCVADGAHVRDVVKVRCGCSYVRPSPWASNYTCFAHDCRSRYSDIGTPSRARKAWELYCACTRLRSPYSLLPSHTSHQRCGTPIPV